MRRLARRWFIVMFCFFAAIALAADEGVKEYEVPNHGSLKLAPPKTWKQAIRPAPPGLPVGPTVEFSDPAGKDFKVLISIVPDFNGNPDFNSPASLKAMVEKLKAHFLPGAKEKDVQIMELKGPHMVGYYFMVTDKAPKPGEYECMTTAALGVGDLLLPVTILHHAPDTPDRQAALTMLKNAEQAAKK
ncbi:MAG: hypothetical protein GC162_09105 [Planctomycetes bacterium]|nr:hypothetical protein [Planctomycetota bacterium]